ncbi:MAG: nucleoside deaminase, partial [Bacilli bacterium]
MEKKITQYMQEALKEANQALEHNEVPVGAILVSNDQIIARAYNTNQGDQNIISHAEIKVIEQACQLLKTRYLDETELYVTLEPCMMCTGAIIQAKIDRVYFGAFDLEAGSLISNEYNINNKSIK